LTGRGSDEGKQDVFQASPVVAAKPQPGSSDRRELDSKRGYGDPSRSTSPHALGTKAPVRKCNAGALGVVGNSGSTADFRSLPSKRASSSSFRTVWRSSNTCAHQKQESAISDPVSEAHIPELEGESGHDVFLQLLDEVKLSVTTPANMQASSPSLRAASPTMCLDSNADMTISPSAEILSSIRSLDRPSAVADAPELVQHYSRSLLLRCRDAAKKAETPSSEAILCYRMLHLPDAYSAPPRRHSSPTWQVSLREDMPRAESGEDDEMTHIKAMMADDYSASKPSVAVAHSERPSQGRPASHATRRSSPDKRRRGGVRRRSRGLSPARSGEDESVHDTFAAARLAAGKRSASVDCLRETDSRPTRLKREVLPLLNKISPDNEAVIAGHLAEVELEGPEDFKCIAQLMFEKAVDEPFYSELYVRAMTTLSLKYPILSELAGSGSRSSHSGDACGRSGRRTRSAEPWGVSGFSSFAASIVEQCNDTFEKLFGRCGMFEGDEDEEGIEAVRERHRAQSYMRVLGHLYSSGVLSTDSLEYWIRMLLLVGDQDGRPERSCPPQAWIECACELLFTIGKDLSKSKVGKEIIQMAVHAMHHWKSLRRPTSGHRIGGDSAAPHVFPARILFLMQEVIDASRKAWPARYVDNMCTPEKMRCQMHASER